MQSIYTSIVIFTLLLGAITLSMAETTKPMETTTEPVEAAGVVEAVEIVADTTEVEVVAEPTEEEKAQAIHNLRVKKFTRIVQTFYNYQGRASILPYVDHFISEHERIEREAIAKGITSAKGFASTWWWSAVYGGANFSLTCYGVAPGGCAGPMDVKHYPLVRDPKKNITWHIEEQFYGWKLGYRGRGLCEYVMYPARPHDWGGGKFRKTHAKHLACIERGYEFGKLP